jgi:hypothetical protein
MQATDNTPNTDSGVVLLTVQRFCHERSLPRSSFYKEVKAGRIKPVKRGRRTLIHRDEARRYDNSLPAAA